MPKRQMLSPILPLLLCIPQDSARPAAASMTVDALPAAAKAAVSGGAGQRVPHVVSNDGFFTWGSSVLRADDGSYHMFYARWPKALGWTAWLPCSEVVHAVATVPEGPFRDVGVAVPADGEDRGHWFTAHNPKIKQFEGRYYLYFIQTRGDVDAAKRREIARTGYRHPQWKELRENQRTFVAVADSLDGPWEVTRRPIVEPARTITTLTVNPAVCRGPDGTYFMIVKGDKPGETRFVRNQALATAPAPEGPWTIHEQAVIDDLDTEDASIWYDPPARRFFAVFHAHRFIGLMTSDDGFAWRKHAQYELTSKRIGFDDDTTWQPDRMERPFVLTDERGQARILYVACKKGPHSVNVAVPLARAKN